MTSARSQTRAAQTSAAPAFGVAEWFRPGDHMRVLDSLDHVEALGASWLRTHLSWADFHAPGGQDWYDWLIPTLAARVEVLPCIHYTPPSLSRTGTSAGPPHRPQDLADFVDLALSRYGHHFPRIELWNEPNNLLDWDWRADPDWQIFCEMIGAAACWTVIIPGPGSGSPKAAIPPGVTTSANRPGVSFRRWMRRPTGCTGTACATCRPMWRCRKAGSSTSAMTTWACWTIAAATSCWPGCCARAGSPPCAARSRSAKTTRAAPMMAMPPPPAAGPRLRC